MRNRVVGSIVIVISLLLGFIILSFNMALNDIVNTSCSHGTSCPMWGSIEFHTNVSIGIMVFVLILGFYLIFFSKEERIITRIKKIRPQAEAKRLTKQNYRKIMSGLKTDEKKIFVKIIESQGSILQSKLVVLTKMNKVRVTRILDRLEGKGLVERKRRGMRNVIVLKH